MTQHKQNNKIFSGHVPTHIQYSQHLDQIEIIYELQKTTLRTVESQFLCPTNRISQNSFINNENEPGITTTVCGCQQNTENKKN